MLSTAYMVSVLHTILKTILHMKYDMNGMMLNLQFKKKLIFIKVHVKFKNLLFTECQNVFNTIPGFNMQYNTFV